jgi:peptidyl-prolyl cis-trans isomerase C
VYRCCVFVVAVLVSAGCQRTTAESQTPAVSTGASKPLAVQTPAASGQQTPANPQAQPPAPAAGQGQPAGQPPQPGQQPPQAPVKPVPATLPEVVAKIENEAISKSDFERAIRTIEARAGRAVPVEQRDRVYRQVLDELVNIRLVAHEGKTRNIAVTDADVDGQIGKIRQQFKTEEEFKQALTQRKLSLEELKTEAKTEILVNKTLEAEILPKVAVQPADLDTYYKANPDQFKAPEQVRASHILIPINASMTDAQKLEAKTQAEGLLKRVKAGEDFAALAKQYSKDSTAQSGGDLNFFPKGQMVPAFDQVAFSLKPGEISNIVETPFGYHIIKVTERKDAHTVPLAEVSDRLSDFLKQRKQQELTSTFIQSLHGKYKIEILI